MELCGFPASRNQVKMKEPYIFWKFLFKLPYRGFPAAPQYTLTATSCDNILLDKQIILSHLIQKALKTIGLSSPITE